MPFISRQEFDISDLKLELFVTHGQVYQNYPQVLSGHIFHFTHGPSIIDVTPFNFSVDEHWKKQIFGSLADLKLTLSDIKNKLLNLNQNLYADIDQFAYIHLFIIPHYNQHSLVITSDTFDVYKLLDLQ